MLIFLEELQAPSPYHIASTSGEVLRDCTLIAFILVGLVIAADCWSRWREKEKKRSADSRAEALLKQMPCPHCGKDFGGETASQARSTEAKIMAESMSVPITQLGTFVYVPRWKIICPQCGEVSCFYPSRNRLCKTPADFVFQEAAEPEVEALRPAKSRAKLWDEMM
jgi:hypothetical protein